MRQSENRHSALVQCISASCRHILVTFCSLNDEWPKNQPFIFYGDLVKSLVSESRDSEIDSKQRAFVTIFKKFLLSQILHKRPLIKQRRRFKLSCLSSSYCPSGSSVTLWH